MSLTSSPALAALASASNEPECEPSPSAKSTLLPAVLRRHWPDVPVYDDVRTLTAARLMADAEWINGNEHTKGKPRGRRMAAPCDRCHLRRLPLPGHLRRRQGRRHCRRALRTMAEYARIIGEVRPRYVIVENVAALLHRGLGEFSGTCPRSGMMRSGTAYQLPPLVRLTDATGSGLWPTPTVATAGRTSGSEIADASRGAAMAAGCARSGRRRHACEWKQGCQADAEQAVKRCGRRRTSQRLDQMSAARMLEFGVTEQRRTHTNNAALQYRGLAAQRGVGGSLNPTWVEWLMGFPLGWTDLEPSATPSSRKSRKSSDGQS